MNIWTALNTKEQLYLDIDIQGYLDMQLNISWGEVWT